MAEEKKIAEVNALSLYEKLGPEECARCCEQAAGWIFATMRWADNGSAANSLSLGLQKASYLLRALPITKAASDV